MMIYWWGGGGGGREAGGRGVPIVNTPNDTGPVCLVGVRTWCLPAANNLMKWRIYVGHTEGRDIRQVITLTSAGHHGFDFCGSSLWLLQVITSTSAGHHFESL